MDQIAGTFLLQKWRNLPKLGMLTSALCLTFQENLTAEISGGKHFLQMIYSRFSKYISVLKKNKRLSIRTLYSISANDVRTTTGSNVRKILLKSGIDPRCVPKQKFSDWRVYSAVDTWTVPLLSSLLELRSDAWEVNFDVEAGECLEDEEINFMIEAVCTG